MYRQWTKVFTRSQLSRNENGRIGALKSDSTHHFFRNACTKSGSLRFSQFSGCSLILSVHMSFDFPFVRLFGNFVITLIHTWNHVYMLFCGVISGYIVCAIIFKIISQYQICL